MKNVSRFIRGGLVAAGTAAALAIMDHTAAELPGLLKGALGGAAGGVLLIFVNYLRDKLKPKS